MAKRAAPALFVCLLALGAGSATGDSGSVAKLIDLRVSSGSPPYAGDTRLRTTVTPGPGRLRSHAVVSFTLAQAASVRAEALFLLKRRVARYWISERRFEPGRHRMVWQPGPATPSQSYLVRLTVSDRFGKRVYGSPNDPASRSGSAAVVRIRRIDAGFTLRSYAPGQRATLRLATDARYLTLRVLRAGAERGNRVGRPWAPPRSLLWRLRDRPGQLTMRVGPWPSGLYFLRVSSRDGRVGYAPFIVRAAVPGRSRVAVVLPTNTWQAYNFWDVDGDGRGDSWYVDDRRTVIDLRRPYFRGGKPPHYRSYDRGFLRFLVHTGKAADYFSDDDLEDFGTGDELGARYDLVVFSGHEEYVTRHVYDLVERFRDLGGNLAFLSSNNFFWHVERQGQHLWRGKQWRAIGRPEARLIGVQYRTNDRGAHAGSYTVVSAERAPWLFEGLGVANGSQLGPARYGIEFDMTTPESPPGTAVLAEVDPGLPERSIRGQMSYYETPAGSKVFAAGTLGFGGSDNPTATVLFANLWARLSVP